jgi:hypothetical protein
MDCAEDHTGAAGKQRHRRESVLTISFIVSSAAAPLAGQALHRGNYSRFY